ncbi:MAG: transglutaminase-like domain-containing protein [Bacteroidota bacterium]
MSNPKTDLSIYLKPTYYMDWKKDIVTNKARELTESIPEDDLTRKAVALFYYVRDQIKYVVQKTPKGKINWFQFYRSFMKSSRTLKRGHGYCIPKAILLASFARASGIPSRLHFVDINNHKNTKSLNKILGGNIFAYHGYTELYLDGKWIKATPNFDKELSEKEGYPLVEFDGKNHATLAPEDSNGDPFVEYIKDHGVISDVPYKNILKTWVKMYVFK